MENFKTDILGTLTTQIDIMQAKQKQMEAEQNFAIFCPRCRKKHSHKECPLDTVQTCAICTKDHLTESCPSLPGLKAVYKEVEEEPKLVYLLNQRCQWQPRQSGMFPDPTSSFQPRNIMLNNIICGKVNPNPRFQTSHHSRFLLQTRG